MLVDNLIFQHQNFLVSINFSFNFSYLREQSELQKKILSSI
ncbi:hypothetical protein STRMA_0327 [Streptococcus macacae NCTC 11558]|uniref:Uncharacterized protein n=1 Tax=Streptococcus macacae NCTC 11558 TaxID=764298 RepID=G5JYR3_9STRE|nr:hypothetical protein STRMA_0327 [Streptococcus macacae NCTC 11558]